MRLAIANKNDIIAFAGLATCGLIAAFLGSQRGERIAAKSMARKREDLIHLILSEWDSEASAESQLARILLATRDAYPLSGAVVRDERNTVAASTVPGDELRRVPLPALAPDTLLPVGTSARALLSRILPLPIEDGRVALAASGRPVGWLELRGDGTHASAESRRALSDVARLIAVLLVSRGHGTRSRD
jgi:hypothetical protein